MPKSADQSTKDRLLDAAFEVIADDGWSAASTRAIAARAGVNNALVHYHFGSVEALRLAAVDRVRERAIRRPLEALAAAPRLLDGIVEAVESLADPQVDERLLRVLMALRSQIHVDDQARASAAARLGEMRAEWARRLTDEEGLAPDDARAAAELLLAQLVGLVSDHLTDPDTPTGPAARLLAELIRARTRHEETPAR